jgi:histone H3/H4
MYSSMRDFYREFVEPTLKDIAADTKRQADKEENINVQVGNRDITRAVDIQREANGYSFT